MANILTNENHLPLIYGLLFGMPGIPCIYYGSEWGARAWKEEGESALRACFDAGSGSGEEHLNGQKVELMLTMTFMIFQRAAS